MPRPVELCKRMSEQRAAVGQIRRQLPKPGPGQSREEARCAYFLESAQRMLLFAENAWDEEPRQPGEAPDA